MAAAAGTFAIGSDDRYNSFDWNSIEGSMENITDFMNRVISDEYKKHKDYNIIKRNVKERLKKQFGIDERTFDKELKTKFKQNEKIKKLQQEGRIQEFITNINTGILDRNKGKIVFKDEEGEEAEEISESSVLRDLGRKSPTLKQAEKEAQSNLASVVASTIKSSKSRWGGSKKGGRRTRRHRKSRRKRTRYRRRKTKKRGGKRRKTKRQGGKRRKTRKRRVMVGCRKN